MRNDTSLFNLGDLEIIFSAQISIGFGEIGNLQKLLQGKSYFK